jgi:hypothetical protein
MAEAVRPRIKLDKKSAKKGDIIEVKALVSHIMETGQRRDSAGRVSEPLHPIQVPGAGVRPGGSDLDRRRRFQDRRSGQHHSHLTVHHFGDATRGGFGSRGRWKFV